MPDPEMKTVSATEMGQVLDRSPYGTRYSLYHAWRGVTPRDTPADGRMNFGKFAQPYILERAAAELRLEVLGNPEDEYVRHPQHPVGCTRDARTMCPQRGAAVVECKLVEGLQWKLGWDEQHAPPHVEIQLQVQMLAQQADWGVIACMVGHDDKFLLYPRKPDVALQKTLIAEAGRFIEDVAAGREPDAYGLAVEMLALDALYPEVEEDKTITDMDDGALAEDVRLLAFAMTQVASFKKTVDQLKPKVLAASKDARFLRVFGSQIKISKTLVEAQVMQLDPEFRQALLFLADALKNRTPTDRDKAVEMLERIADWRVETKRAHVRSALKIEQIDDGDRLMAEFDRQAEAMGSSG